METRYLRNHCAISPEEQCLLREKRAVVIGLGGLGGYAVECMGRLGVGRMTLVDGDIFEHSNLNRQLLATSTLIGQPKVTAACQRLTEINPLVSINPIQQRLTAENAEEILAGHDVVVDALDNIADRLILESAAFRLQIPLVHGAIAGWSGQLCTVMPGDNTLHYLYADVQESSSGEESELGNLSFTAAAIAAMQAAEAVKVLLGRGALTRRMLLQVDLLDNRYEQIPLRLP